MIKIISMLLVVSSVGAEQLSLPQSLASKPIVHLKVRQLDNWSCGYNALYNACLAEQRAGLNNSSSILSHFELLCSSYLRSKRANPQEASSNTTLTDLADKLKLENLCCLYLDKHNTVEPFFDTPTSITFKYGLSQREKDQLMEKTKKQRGVTLFKELKQKFIAQKLCCMHFICNVQEDSIKHWVLVSLVKKSPSDVMLYICDNMNRKITERSQIKKYIDYLYNFFIG
ncbi:hypothetical protein H0X48_00685 [Candidatus Dependentiae bacterium]|nr:hypothetical protein [Candidatus Dependentiae bacterium]